MIFKRKIYAQLLEWKEKWADKRALLIQGARRIGKSTVVEEFAKSEYKSYILINFQVDRNLVEELFKTSISNLDEFFRTLSLLYRKQLYKKESLIIFDEVQLFPIARQSIKQLVADGRYHFIETGSLITLQQNVENILIPSEERSINMFPLDFEEFLWTQGDFVTASIIRDCFQTKKPLGDIAHRKIMNSFRLYMAVGGMPQAINALLESNDFTMIDEIKREILSLYAKDLKKLDSKYTLSTSLILRSIPSELSSHTRLFKTSALGKNARISRKYNSFEAIKDSMIVNIANDCTDPNFTPSLTVNLSKQKIYMGDTGLLISQLFNSSENPIEQSIYKQLIVDKTSLNMGMIFENVVAQMLKANGHELYFHSFNQYEIDFLLPIRKKVIPLEVKSSSYKSHKSLSAFCEKYSERVINPYVIYSKDLKKDGQVTLIPIYMTMCL